MSLVGTIKMIPEISTVEEVNETLAPPEEVIVETVMATPELETIPLYESLGTFRITHYCSCKKCTGSGEGITKSGTQATAGRTIAVDRKVIPLGTIVLIDGTEYVAEDIGGAIKGNKVDIYVEGHQEALDLGVKKLEVFIKHTEE